jgi:serine/threonine protein kinase
VTLTPTGHGGTGLPRRLGPWELVERLGSGGAGEVFLAHLAEERPYAALGDRLAVKVLHSDRLPEDETFLRFQREVRLGQAFDHPCLVRTLDAELLREDGATGSSARHVLVMEHVAGRTLRDSWTSCACSPSRCSATSARRSRAASRRCTAAARSTATSSPAT